MAEIIPIRRKTKKGSNVHTRINRCNRQYEYHRVENYQYSRSEKQADMRQEWGERRKAISAWVKANSTPPTEAYIRAEKAFRRAKYKGQYKEFHGFLMANPRYLAPTS